MKRKVLTFSARVWNLSSLAAVSFETYMHFNSADWIVQSTAASNEGNLSYRNGTEEYILNYERKRLIIEYNCSF